MQRDERPATAAQIEYARDLILKEHYMNFTKIYKVETKKTTSFHI